MPASCSAASGRVPVLGPPLPNLPSVGQRNAEVARKFAAAREAGLTPVLCVGETLDQREAHQTEQRIEAVLELVGIQGFRQAMSQLVVVIAA